MIFFGNQPIKASETSGAQGSSTQDLKVEERDKKLSVAVQTTTASGATSAAVAASSVASSTGDEDFVQDEGGIKSIAKSLWMLVQDKSQKSLSEEQMKSFGKHVVDFKKLANSWKKDKEFTTSADHLLEVITNIAEAYASCAQNDLEGLVVATRYGLFGKQDYFLK